MNLLRNEIQVFFTALMFYTRIPCPKWVNHDAEYLNKATRYFPLIGWIVGGVCALVFYLASFYLSKEVSLILSFVSGILITGAFHEDGFADVCDGFGGGWNKEKILDIMKDSRIGTYGAVGMGLAIALRAAILTALPHAFLLPALIASACFGRYLAVCLMACVVPVMRTSGLAKDIGAQTQMGQWAAASVLTLPFVVPLFIMTPVPVLAALGVSALFLLWFRRFLLRHLGGVTGDCLGFGVYMGQIILLLAAAANIT